MRNMIIISNSSTCMHLELNHKYITCAPSAIFYLIRIQFAHNTLRRIGQEFNLHNRQNRDAQDMIMSSPIWTSATNPSSLSLNGPHLIPEQSSEPSTTKTSQRSGAWSPVCSSLRCRE